jgi:hypothetical protein
VVFSLKKKILWCSAFLVVAVLAALIYAAYSLTRPFHHTFAQDPNTVEALEATRKLKLLNEAQAARRQGFVRLSEVEINSFIDGRYNSGNHSRTNDLVKLVKSGVILGEKNVTFVTWHQAPILGLNLPFVWQRTVSPVHSTNGWTFTLHSMRVGQMEIPAKHWDRVNGFLGRGDSLFEDRQEWLQSLPFVTLARNDQSKAPEIRLYSYLPKEKARHSDIVSE